MELVYGFFARYAETTPEGIFNAVGSGFDTIRLDKFPGTVPSLALLVKIKFPPEECNKTHEIKFRLIRPDGSADVDMGIASVKAVATAAESPGRGNGYSICLLSIYGAEFPSEGLYEVRILSAEKKVGEIFLQFVGGPAGEGDVANEKSGDVQE